MNERELMRTSERNHLLLLPVVRKSIVSVSCSFYLTYNSVTLGDIFSFVILSINHCPVREMNSATFIAASGLMKS